MIGEKYILDGKKPKIEKDLFKWAGWMATADRIVAKTIIRDVTVSTVFLGLDYSFRGKGPPILFETMIFGGKLDHYMVRYSTWEEAEAGHKECERKVMEEEGIGVTISAKANKV